MSLIFQNNTENTIESTPKLYISLINHLTDTGIDFKSHTLKLLDANKYLSNNKCTICIQEFDDYTHICMLSCRHIFHIDCITKYLEEKKECAICRHSVTNWIDYSSMSVYISNLKLQCCQQNCFYFATQNSINEAKDSIASIANSLPDDDEEYENFNTNIEKTADNEDYNSFLAKHLLKEYTGKKQQLLIKLFSNIKKLNNHTEQNLLLGNDEIQKQSIFADKSFLEVESCPYPNNILNIKQPDNFFATYYSIIYNYIINIITCYLPLGYNIKSIKYSLQEQKIILKITTRNIDISCYFNEKSITNHSNTTRKCLYIVYINCCHFIKLCKIINKYPHLSNKQNTLYYKSSDINNGKILFSYQKNIIYIDFIEFSTVPNDFNINFTSFKQALERNGIDPKYLATENVFVE